MNTTKFHIAKRINMELLKHTPYELRICVPDSNIDVASIGLIFAQQNSQHKVSLIQVGACDGSTGDPVYKQILTGNINAILVEPITENFLALESNYKSLDNVIAVQAAIGKKDGRANFYKVKNTGRWKDSCLAKQLGSFNVSHLERHGVYRSEIETIDTPVLTLETLIKNIM